MTTSRLIDSTEDEDFNDGEWPYPTQYNTYLIEGDLAERVLARTGIEGPVTIKETVTSGGYSEYTQETYYDFTVQVGTTEVFDTSSYESLDDDFSSGVFAKMNSWLEEE